MLDVSPWSARLKPWIVRYCIVPQWRSWLLRNRTALADIKRAGLILDVGCGQNVRPGNINLDRNWCPGIDVVWDVARRLPFPDNYVGGIFTEHCIEHVPFDGALAAFREFHRIMQPATYLRVVVPDFEIYVDRYQDFRRDGTASMPFMEEDRRPDGIYSPAMSVNRIFRHYGHQYMYDFATVQQMLAATGFVDIAKRACGQGACPELLLDQDARAVESLYVEARKPRA